MYTGFMYPGFWLRSRVLVMFSHGGPVGVFAEVVLPQVRNVAVEDLLGQSGIGRIKGLDQPSGRGVPVARVLIAAFAAVLAFPGTLLRVVEGRWHVSARPGTR